MRPLAALALTLLLAEIAGAQIPTSGLPSIGLVGDFSGHYGSESSGNCTAARLDCGAFNGNFSQYNFLVGPRVSASLGKVRPFADYWSE